MLSTNQDPSAILWNASSSLQHNLDNTSLSLHNNPFTHHGEKTFWFQVNGETSSNGINWTSNTQ